MKNKKDNVVKFIIGALIGIVLFACIIIGALMFVKCINIDASNFNFEQLHILNDEPDNQPTIELSDGTIVTSEDYERFITAKNGEWIKIFYKNGDIDMMYGSFTIHYEGE